MTKTNLSTVLALIPRSDEQLARDIGISSKTIKRIKHWYYEPSDTTTRMIEDYLDNIWFEIHNYFKHSYIPPRSAEISDLPKARTLSL